MVSTGHVPIQQPSTRLDAVRRYRILDAPPDHTFEHVAWLAATVIGTPIATVSIVDVDRVWFAASHGLDGVRQVGTEPGLCASVVLRDGPYLVSDAAVDPRTLDHPLVRGELGLRFYAAAPIVTADGHQLGTVNVIDRQPRDATDTELAMLTRLAAIVAEHLDIRLAALNIVRSERQLRDAADVPDTAGGRRAAQLRAAAAGTDDPDRPATCQLGGRTRCHAPAELRIADSWGDAAWGCLAHVEDAILHAPNVFIADPGLAGLSAYLCDR